MISAMANLLKKKCCNHYPSNLQICQAGRATGRKLYFLIKFGRFAVQGLEVRYFLIYN